MHSGAKGKALASTSTSKTPSQPVRLQRRPRIYRKTWNMTDEQINQVAVLRRAGNRNVEIAQMLNMTYDQVVRCVSRARQRNWLPPKPKANPRQAVLDLVKGNGMRQGRISDMMMALSKEEKVWLIGDAQREGYETLAEWLTDVVRAKYDKENEL